jgi:UDP-glucuronate 4-epimerase
MEQYSGLRVLVTGGAGFIGSHLTEALIASGAHVCALDNFDLFYPRTEKERNLSNAAPSPQFTLAEGDIRDRAFVQETLRAFSPNLIVHLAARAGVRPSLEDPVLYSDVNLRGTTILLEEARKANVRNIVFASSSSVYGNSPSVPFRESDRTDSPVSPYGATKKAGEVLCHTFHSVYGMSIACLRFFTVYGPRQRPDLAIRKFVNLALLNQEIPMFGDGRTRRDYTHITDILSGILGAMRWVQSSAPRYGIFNLGSSNPIELRELVAMIEQELGAPVRKQLLPFQQGDVIQTFADSSLAQQELGFRHDIEFRDGLREFVAWMKQQPR